jgi:hypothetical protein
MTKMNQIDYFKNIIPLCPHCKAEFNVWDDDRQLSLNYDDGGKSEWECPKCNASFVVVTHVEYRFSTAVSDDAADDEEWGPAEAAA